MIKDDTLSLLADAAAAFARPDPKRVRALRESVLGFDRSVWRQMGRLGWLSVLLPEPSGGLGLGVRAAATIARQLGFAAFPEPYVACGLMTTACLRECGTAPASELLEQIASGETLTALAWQGPRGDLDLQSPGVAARIQHTGLVLNGEARFIPLAAGDCYVVAARNEGGIALCLVPAASRGLTCAAERRPDGGQSARLRFSGVAVARDRILTMSRAKFVDVISIGLVATSAELLGLMERMLQLTLEYLRARKQFGRPIGSFQVLQHRAVDLWMQKELARAAVESALAVLDDPESSHHARTRAAAGAKSRASDAALCIAKQSVQLHGAIGTTDEYELSVYFNRALVLATWLGDGPAHRRRYSSLPAAPEDVSPPRIRYKGPRNGNWNELSDHEFRAIVRAEFEEHYPPALRYPPRRLRWSENRDWYLRMSQKGWIAPNWPVEYGGMGLEPAKLIIYFEEQERWGVARFQDHGIQMVGPVLIRHGTEEQRRRYLPKILSCEHIWCQGYSEPDAGSDLASLRTRAKLVGEHFVINGQKTWTTLAHDATHMFLLARTDPAAKKQEGISFLLIDLSSPGVKIRPIRDLAGHEEFCEVFLEDVRTHASNLVGALNQGWTVARSLLGFERIFLGSPKLPEYGLGVLQSVAKARGMADDPLFREKYSALELDVAHVAALYAEYAGIASRGEELGPGVSMLKIFSTETFQRIADLTLETAGPAAGLAGEVDLGGEYVNVLAPFYKSRAPSIYGGSNEIQRNIIARNLLDLPVG